MVRHPAAGHTVLPPEERDSGERTMGVVEGLDITRENSSALRFLSPPAGMDRSIAARTMGGWAELAED